MFCFFPPLVLIKANGSLLRTAGNPERDSLRKYAKLNLLSTFF